MKHTPGPWKIFREKMEDGFEPDLYIGHERNDYQIGRIEHSCLAFGEANAKLISSAPDLLEACKHAAKSNHHPACKCKREYLANPERYCTCHVQKARKAILRAEGKETP